ncbi:DUF1778 domain-containing protein [Amycolatopsis sp. VS8301801F10]|uniref:type II toxin -antitoxin system TacA 1-like antitoxin n=1 Tax=unclassified Amycolatopsis TaxID=2618356 RepID=UPI0038FC492F
MDLSVYVDRLGREFAGLVAADDDDILALLERRKTPLESLIRLVLLDLLTTAASEITRDLAPGSVELRLRGSSPEFVITPPAPESGPADPAGHDFADDRPPSPSPVPAGLEDTGMARINFRTSDQLKALIDEAAAKEGSSVNAWLIRVVSAALQRDRAPQPDRRSTRAPQRRTGWVR